MKKWETSEIEFLKNNYLISTDIELSKLMDSSRGYELNNCLPCCFVCNKMKMDMTKKDFLETIERIYLFTKENKNGQQMAF